MPENSKIPRYDKASLEEINALKKFIKKITDERQDSINDISKTPPPSQSGNLIQPPLNKTQTFHETQKELGRKTNEQARAHGNLFEGGIAHVEITREPINCDNPVQWLLWLCPELTPYKWQFETLMQAAGYLYPGRFQAGDKSEITQDNPFLFAGRMANGSGKDFILIAAFATWFVVTKARNRVIVTSSSHEQIKYQTEPHIRDLCNRANSKFGCIFKSKEFHHIVPELGSEVKLFVTDEAGRAEGYHAFHGGNLAIVLNEAKSIPEQINIASERYTGLTHRIEISSPGGKSGFFYNNVVDLGTIAYPAPVKLGRYYTRRVTAYDCPHIKQSAIQRKIDKYGTDSILVKSSIDADFTELDQPVVISDYEYSEWIKSIIPQKDDNEIGIGLDIAAGGDEDACFVRAGNKVVHKFFFRNPSVIEAANLIDLQLTPWKDRKYAFRADNGGVGMGCIDRLTELGWRVIRTNNQSPAYDKRGFLNLGAEMWFHLKRLIVRKEIRPEEIKNVDKLQRQLTTRFWKGLDSTQGKYALESKIEAKAQGRSSPDRADALVLCFASYRPQLNIRETPTKLNLLSLTQLLQKFYRSGIPFQAPPPTRMEIPTLMNKQLH